VRKDWKAGGVERKAIPEDGLIGERVAVSLHTNAYNASGRPDRSSRQFFEMKSGERK